MIRIDTVRELVVCDHNRIIVTDIVTGRKEEVVFISEAKAARVLSDFLLPDGPGPEFRRYFPDFC